MIATSESVGPRSLEFRVYRMSIVEGQSLDDVAETFGISVPRAMQLRDQACATIARQCAQQTLSDDERRRASEYIAWGQLQYLYQLCLEAWEESKQPETIVQRIGVDRTVTITRPSYGKPCYLAMANKISAQQVRLMAPLLPLMGIDPLDEQQDLALQRAFSPPVRDCSPEAESATETAEEEDDGLDESDWQPVTSGDTLGAGLCFRGDVARPVQPPFSGPVRGTWRDGVLTTEPDEAECDQAEAAAELAVVHPEEEDAVTAAEQASAAGLFTQESAAAGLVVSEPVAEDAEQLVDDILAGEKEDEEDGGPMSVRMRRPLSRKERRRRQRLSEQGQRRAK